MTRVILTNKKTGQELPEAEMRIIGKVSLDVRFDGTDRSNAFDTADWDYREVRQFRNGDVLRRKYRGDENYIHFDGWWYEVATSDYPATVKDLLDNPEWEVV